MDDKLKDVIRKHHGGFDKATDGELKRIFDRLPIDMKDAYRKETEEHASSKRSKSDVQSSTGDRQGKNT